MTRQMKKIHYRESLMSLNEKYIRENCHLLYHKIAEQKPYSFSELKEISGLENPMLCLVLIQLIKEKKMEQKIKDKKIYYLKY